MPRLDARGCLGLLLVITGIRSLGSPLLGLFQMLRFDSDPDSTTIVLTALPLATSVLQIGAGCAFAFHKPTAGWIALTGYLMSVVGFVVVFVFELRPREVGGLSLLAMAGESLGHPIVFVVALAMARTAGSNARREVGVMLIIYALIVMQLLLYFHVL